MSSSSENENRKRMLKRIEGKIETFIEQQIVDQQIEKLVDQYEKILDKFETNDMTAEEHDECNKNYIKYFAYVQKLKKSSTSQLPMNFKAINCFINDNGDYEGDGDITLNYKGNGQQPINNEANLLNSFYNDKKVKTKGTTLNYTELSCTQNEVLSETSKVSNKNLTYGPIEVLQDKTDNMGNSFFFECEAELFRCSKERAKKCMSIFNKILADFPTANNFKILKIKNEVIKEIFNFVSTKKVDNFDLSNDLLEAAKLFGMHEFEEELKTKINEKTAFKGFSLINQPNN